MVMIHFANPAGRARTDGLALPSVLFAHAFSLGVSLPPLAQSCPRAPGKAFTFFVVATMLAPPPTIPAGWCHGNGRW